MADEPFLTVHQVYKRLATAHAVAEVTLAVRSGEIFALGVLMHGKEPSLAEFWRWGREA